MLKTFRVLTVKNELRMQGIIKYKLLGDPERVVEIDTESPLKDVLEFLADEIDGTHDVFFLYNSILPNRGNQFQITPRLYTDSGVEIEYVKFTKGGFDSQNFNTLLKALGVVKTTTDEVEIEFNSSTDVKNFSTDKYVLALPCMGGTIPNFSLFSDRKLFGGITTTTPFELMKSGKDHVSSDNVESNVFNARLGFDVVFRCDLRFIELLKHVKRLYKAPFYFESDNGQFKGDFVLLPNSDSNLRLIYDTIGMYEYTLRFLKHVEKED